VKIEIDHEKGAYRRLKYKIGPQIYRTVFRILSDNDSRELQYEEDFQKEEEDSMRFHGGPL
jgi:hypothetical protein